MVGGKQFRATPVRAELGGGGGPPCSQPLVGEQFAQSLLGMATDAFEDVAEVGKGIDVEPLAGGDEAGQHGGGAPTLVAAVEHPILSAHRDSTQAALGAVVIDLQIPVFAVAGQRLPI